MDTSKHAEERSKFSTVFQHAFPSLRDDFEVIARENMDEGKEIMSIHTQSTTKARFETLCQQWTAHCEQVQLSSDMRDYLDHPAFHELVSLGDEVVPLIIECYRNDDFVPWGFVLEGITDQGFIQDRKRFSPAKVKQQWLAWWDNDD